MVFWCHLSVPFHIGEGCTVLLFTDTRLERKMDAAWQFTIGLTLWALDEVYITSGTAVYSRGDKSFEGRGKSGFDKKCFRVSLIAATAQLPPVKLLNALFSPMRLHSRNHSSLLTSSAVVFWIVFHAWACFKACTPVFIIIIIIFSCTETAMWGIVYLKCTNIVAYVLIGVVHLPGSFHSCFLHIVQVHCPSVTCC